MVTPGTEVPIAEVGVAVGGVPAGVRSVVTVGRKEAVKVGEGVSVEMGWVRTGKVGAGLVAALSGSDVAVGS
jgi:hypothetical protein